MKKILKEMKWDALLTGVLYIVLGIVALAIPETMEKVLGYMVGVILIVGGAVSMISYLLRDAHQNYYHNDFFHGLLGIAAGIFVLVKMDIIIALVPFLLGIMVLVSGCSKLQDVIDMKRLEYGNWILMLVFAAVNVAFGILLMYDPFQSAALLFRLLGVGLIFSGITDCAVTVYFAGKIRRYLEELMAVDSTSVKETDPDLRKTDRAGQQCGGTDRETERQEAEKSVPDQEAERQEAEKSASAQAAERQETEKSASDQAGV